MYKHEAHCKTTPHWTSLPPHRTKRKLTKPLEPKIKISCLEEASGSLYKLLNKTNQSLSRKQTKLKSPKPEAKKAKFT